MTESTHWDGCHKDRKHHACAVALVDSLRTRAKAAEKLAEERLALMRGLVTDNSPFCASEVVSKPCFDSIKKYVNAADAAKEKK